MGNQISKRTAVGEHTFRLHYPLGPTSNGTLWKGGYRDGKDEFAIKVVPAKTVAVEKIFDNLLIEREIMISVGSKNPFIAPLYYSFSSPTAFYFVMPKQTTGNLFFVLRCLAQPFTETQARFYACEVIVALEALHQNHYVYRDLKLENVSLTPEGHVMLHDFGFSRKASPPLCRVHSFSGSNIYISPEILTDRGDGHSFSVDWWSLGVFLFLLLTQKAPFFSEKNEEIFELIQQAKLPDLEPFGFTPHTNSLLEELLTRNPRKRLGSVPSRAKRKKEEVEPQDAGPNGAEFVKQHPFFERVHWSDVPQKKLVPPIIPSTLRRKEFDTSPPEPLGDLSEEQKEYIEERRMPFHYNIFEEKKNSSRRSSIPNSGRKHSIVGQETQEDNKEGNKEDNKEDNKEEEKEEDVLQILCKNCKQKISVFDVDSHSSVCATASNTTISNTTTTTTTTTTDEHSSPIDSSPPT